MTNIELRPGLPALPPGFNRLPRDARGYPVPWFVQWFDDGQPAAAGVGVPDFRVVDQRKLVAAINGKLCWLCGRPLGGYLAFVVGPMCAVNRVSSEPPSHRACAEFAAQACPFLARPQAARREANLPAGITDPAGFAIRRNPGVALVWVTRHFGMHRVDGGVLFRMGPPTSTIWFAEGRWATRDEILASIDSGLPILREAATAEGPDAIAALEAQVQSALQLVPTR